MEIETNSEKKYMKCKDLDRYMKNKKEIGDQAVWSLNSAKQGNGVWQLRDNNYETFWQSDGPIPHKINIQFLQKTRVTDIALYLDSKTDESYTPQILSIRAGLYMQDLKEIVEVELNDPIGWIVIPLKIKCEGKQMDYFYSMNFQIKIKQMFHQGKDTHVRLVKIFTDKEENDKSNPFALLSENVQQQAIIR